MSQEEDMDVFTDNRKTTPVILIAAIVGVFAALHIQLIAQIPEKPKIKAQQLLESTLAAHAELTSLELGATPPGSTTCQTVAATEAKEVGEKCDNDELTALRTKRPFVEKEANEYDVTAPLHDITGKLIGTVGMDIKPQGQTRASVLKLTQAVVRDLERQIPSKASLFEPAQ
jgi:hypothetical protein